MEWGSLQDLDRQYPDWRKLHRLSKRVAPLREARIPGAVMFEEFQVALNWASIMPSDNLSKGCTYLYACWEILGDRAFDQKVAAKGVTYWLLIKLYSFLLPKICKFYNS